MQFQYDFIVIIKFCVTKFATISDLKINSFTTKTIVPDFYFALCLQNAVFFVHVLAGESAKQVQRVVDNARRALL